MKLIRCIKKNMKVLARSKGSALVVLLAPLIIVFIIGLGFMDDTDQRLNMGIHTKEDTDLTKRYIQAFNTTEYNIINYETEQQCINSISEGITVLCAIFSEDFVMRDGAKNELTFHVDESRLNLVDRLIASFSTSLGVETSDISEEITEELLNVVTLTYTEVEESLAKIITSRAQIQTVITQSENAKKEISNMDTKTETTSTNTITSRLNTVESDFIDIRAKALIVVSKAKDISLNDTEDEEDLKDAITTLNETIQESSGIQNIELMQEALASLSSSISKITERLEGAGEAKAKASANLEALETAITTTQQEIDDIKTKQEKIITEIDSFEFKTARSITNPVTTKIESVSSTNDRLTYSFSYLITLAILFVGIMLASTLVYMEKDSKAFFRNFTTPTSQKYFMYINYLTSLIIILIQTALILLIAHFTLNVPILANYAVTLTILFIGITLFITLGLLIGTISSTSEAVTMTNIVIGSVFLFLSNLVLPLETLSPIVSKIAAFNPYVIVSESIRRAMLFDAGFLELYPDIVMLLSYIAIIITFMIIINQLGFKHYIASRRHRMNLLITEPEHLILEMNEEVKVIKNIHELISTLKRMNEEEYQDLIKKENPITEWLRENLKKKMLAYRIKNKKLPKVIELLEKYQNKKDKRTKRKK